MTTVALERGVPVDVEKPIARTLPDAERIAAATGSQTICVVGYQWRGLEFLDHIRRALAHRGTQRRCIRGRRCQKLLSGALAESARLNSHVA
jgi:predicted dehydrogenase